MKAKDLRDRSTEDLKQLREATSREMFHGRMKNHMGQLEDVSQLGKARKTIARIETILSERSKA
jgi:large subunit ribosomal protein L29